jgi:hypothetical protein
MRRLAPVFLAATLTICAGASAAFAQTRPRTPLRPNPEPRVRAMINGGYQPSKTSFDDSFTFSLYQETGTTDTSYSIDAGAIFEGGAAVRLVKGLAFGGVISHFTVDTAATVTSSVPHPFFLQRHRQVSGEPEGLRREETAVHFQAQYQFPPAGKLHVIVAAGPSLIDVKQTLVIDVNYSEQFPFDTATFTGVDSKRAAGTALGFNAGLDFQWMFNPNLGAGALVRFTKATVDLDVDNRIIQVDGGGTQIAAGIRLAF